MKLNIVPARRGIEWLKLGVRVFARQPLAMTGLFITFMASFTLLNLVPFVGSLAALVLLPAATLGYMVATHEALSGRFPMPTLLIAAFRAGRQRLRSMLVLGVMYAAGFLGVIAISALADGGQFARMYLLGGSIDRDALMDGKVLNAIYLAFAAYIPLSLAFWHAPALVHWHGLPPVKSLFFSMVACLKNFRAYALFGLSWFGLTLLTGLVVSLVAGVLGSPALSSAIMLPAMLSMATMFFSSLFFTFHDSFITEQKEESP
jgi:hypothetical protein